MFLRHYSTRDWVVHIHFKLFCQEYFVFWSYCMNLGRFRSHSRLPLFQVQCTQSFKSHRNRAIWRVFCFPDGYSYGSRVLHDLVLRQNYSASGTAMHILDGALVDLWNRYLWLIYELGYGLISEQPFLVRGPLCRETHITPKPYFSPCFSLPCCMGKRPRSVTWRPIPLEANPCTFWKSCTGVMETSFLVHNA